MDGALPIMCVFSVLSSKQTVCASGNRKLTDGVPVQIIILIAAEIFVSLFDMYTKVGSG